MTVASCRFGGAQAIFGLVGGNGHGKTGIMASTTQRGLARIAGEGMSKLELRRVGLRKSDSMSGPCFFGDCLLAVELALTAMLAPLHSYGKVRNYCSSQLACVAPHGLRLRLAPWWTCEVHDGRNPSLCGAASHACPSAPRATNELLNPLKPPKSPDQLPASSIHPAPPPLERKQPETIRRYVL